MKELIGIIVLIFCLLLAVAALRTSDIVIGVVAACLYLIGDRIFRY